MLRTILARSTAAILATGLSTACGETKRPDGGTGLLEVGATVPDLTAASYDGRQVALRGIHGPAIIYFYPKDNTPGCTTEACAFRDAWDRYQEAGVVIVGVSADSAESHQKFAAEHHLPFALIADEDLTWAKAFGVPTIAGVTKRVSFLVGADGKIAKVYPGVDPGVHADEVLPDATGLSK